MTYQNVKVLNRPALAARLVCHALLHCGLYALLKLLGCVAL